MATVEHPPRRGRGRRPADEVRAEILAAAGDLLIAGGMGAFTIDKVAAHSGASKMTIYKWWPSKGALALDGYFHRVEDQLEFPDTGDIEVDLRAQLHAFLAVLRDEPRRSGDRRADRPGPVRSGSENRLSAKLFGAAARPGGLGLETAKARGQLRADLDPETVVDQLWGACYHRLLIPDQPLDEQFVDALVDNLFRGIAPR